MTPASYLELNSLFKSLLGEQRVALSNRKNMYETSLKKLQEAEDQALGDVGDGAGSGGVKSIGRPKKEPHGDGAHDLEGVSSC